MNQANPSKRGANMKILKWLLGVVLLMVAVLLIGGMMLSPKFSVVRNTTIAAPPDKVYGLLADPRRWNEWSVWHQRDPAMQIAYSGAPSGAGAAWEWKSKSEGDGKMTFTAAEPGKRLGYDLYFPDFGTTSQGEFTLVADGAGTRVAWAMNGDMGSNPFFRWMALGADGMVGKDFEAGLKALKQLAEKP